MADHAKLIMYGNLVREEAMSLTVQSTTLLAEVRVQFPAPTKNGS